MTVHRLLACTEDATPCPPSSQVWVTLAEGVDVTQLGITATDVLYVYSWGLGAVLSLWALGVAVGAAVTAIRKV